MPPVDDGIYIYIIPLDLLYLRKTEWKMKTIFIFSTFIYCTSYASGKVFFYPGLSYVLVSFAFGTYEASFQFI